LIGVHGLSPEAAREGARRAARLTALPLLAIIAGAALIAGFAR
jgi:hypothetical protein